MARASRTSLSLALSALAGALSSTAHAQQGSVSGFVVGSDVFGNVQPIAGGFVSVVTPTLETVGVAITEDDGSYVIDAIPPGFYYVFALGEQHDASAFPVQVGAGEPSLISFDLEILRDCLACPFEDRAGELGLGGYVASTGDGHGPGAVFADLNNDLYPDLYVIRAGSANLLYLNVDDGSGHRVFRVPQGIAGAGDPGPGTGAIAGDYDNDGDTDLFVLNFNGPNVLLQNQLAQTGQLWFVDVTALTDPTPGVDDDQFGLAGAVFEGVALDNTLTAAWGDPDRDGDLDLYVGNHDGFFGNPVERPVPGQRDIFYINNGDGTFTDATMVYGVTGYQTEDGGFETPDQWFSSTNAVIFTDVNNDTWIDLLVTNKIGGPDDRDMLYLNLGADGAGTWQGFLPATYLLDPTFGHQSGGAMGVEAGDIDNDGDIDFYITDAGFIPGAGGPNDLWLNLLSETGDLSFIHFDALDAGFSWGVQMQDLDNDGMLDIHVASEWPWRDFLYLSSSFEVARQAGLAQRRNARTSVSADWNLDGWPELFVVNLDGGLSSLFVNQLGLLGVDNHYLVLRLIGGPETLPLPSTRDSIGSRVYVTADLDGDGEIEHGETMLREVVSGSSNAGSSASLELEFGLGQAEAAYVTIVWASGRIETFPMQANQRLVVPDCIADMTTSSNPFDGTYGVPDGNVDADDFFFYLDAFAAGDARADLTGGTRAGEPGYAFPDGTIDADDFFFYLDRFEGGCFGG